MKTFDDIAIRIGAIESLMPSIEKSLDDAFLESGGSPAIEQAQNLVYILTEQIEAAQAEINEVAGHIRVCNAVYAAGRVWELQEEVERLKAEKVK